MSDALIVILVCAAAIGAAMAFWSWRIKRLQYPPELQWPDERKKHRRGHPAKDKPDDG